MKKFIVLALIITVYFSTLEAEDKEVLVIGHTMYQKQKIDYKTVVTFAADKEGERVWNWDHAQRYCKNLKLNNYSDWQVASRAELQKIMTKDQGYNGLYVKNSFAGYMPEPDPKYADVWMWTRDSKASNLGAFVNFKKGKTGWADKKYKGYVICTRNAGKNFKLNTDIEKLKKPLLFEYKKNVWRSDMTQKGTKPLGHYSLLYFYCQNGLNPPILSLSRFIKHKKTTYFFAYKDNNKKRLNLYRTNGTSKGTKKVGSIGNNVAYSPIWVGDKLYFLSNEDLPQQDYSSGEKLWMLDTKINRLRYIGETVTNNSYDILLPFAQSKTKLFFKRWSAGKGIIAGVWVVDQKKGFKKVKGFKKIPDHLKSIKVAGKNYRLSPLKTLPWGCSTDGIQGSFKIEKKSILHKNRQILKFSNVKGLKAHDAKLVFNSENYAVLASRNHLWAVNSRGNMVRLK
jgi:hypothetical protein